MKKKPAPFEVKCEACNGTGFPPVVRLARPGRRIYPPPCTVCGGKGRISTQAAKKKKNEPRRE
jgi:DnaJ-class molecular chaperone